MDTFEQLLHNYTRMIHHIIDRLHIYKNHDAFFQAGRIGLWKASISYDPNKGSFDCYAYVYIMGKIKDELRKERELEDRNIYATEEFWECFQSPVTCHAPEDSLLPLILRRSFTPNQRKWLHYTYVDHLETKEIAEKEQVSLSTVKEWKAGVRKKLRTMKCS
ncbi:sigma-70 family RNA polymerase sigma factor [Bacillus sp. CGMCC 1.16607]|uniref:sigma-70 family RNA polymerase sigma factor n=1 Tax=Bacillus sp. CGMCC 1.16607 TaxID=3351842 RepID=UPI00362CA56D